MLAWASLSQQRLVPSLKWSGPGGGEVIPCGWVSAHRVEAERDGRWSVAGSWRDGRTVSRGRTVRPVGVQAGEGQAPGALEG